MTSCAWSASTACPADELPALLEAKQQRLALLNDPGMSPELLERETAQCPRRRRWRRDARCRALRKAAAATLVKNSVRQFTQLDFPHVELHVDLAQAHEPGPDGLDSAELLISLNPGEPARPLAQVASGGEASRLLLGLKAALAGQLGFHVLLLDEVEAGLGGRYGGACGQGAAGAGAGPPGAGDYAPAGGGRRRAGAPACAQKALASGRSAVSIVASLGD